VTAWRAVMTESHTKAGDIVLVIGTGGVSLFALQYAKALGAQVVVVSGSDEKLEKAKALGADYLVNYKTAPKWGEHVAKITEGGVDTIVETGGSGTLPESLGALAIGGHINTIGHFSGIEGPINIGMIMLKTANIHGITVGSKEDFETMMAFVDEHKITPVSDTRYTFEDSVSAFNAMPQGNHFGKLTISI
jgi:NADPH:quinone reductase-like Zn-dependent oxidoreductase